MNDKKITQRYSQYLVDYSLYFCTQWRNDAFLINSHAAPKMNYSQSVGDSFLLLPALLPGSISCRDNPEQRSNMMNPTWMAINSTAWNLLRNTPESRWVERRRKEKRGRDERKRMKEIHAWHNPTRHLRSNIVGDRRCAIEIIIEKAVFTLSSSEWNS